MKGSVILNTSLILVFLLFIPFVLAQPPQQQSPDVGGLTIEVPVIETIQNGKDFEFHAHIYNDSNGYNYLAVNVDFCYIHIYEPTEGEHIIEDNMSVNGNGIDFEYLVLGGNFTENKHYAVIIYCEVSDTVDPRGGFFEYGLQVTKTGDYLSTADSLNYIIIIIFAFVLLIASGIVFYITPFSDKENELGKITAIGQAKYIKLMFIPITYLIFIWVLNLLLGLGNFYLNSEMYAGFIAMIFNICIWLSYPLLILWFIGVGYQIVVDINNSIQIKKFGV